MKMRKKNKDKIKKALDKVFEVESSKRKADFPLE